MGYGQATPTSVGQVMLGVAYGLGLIEVKISALLKSVNEILSAHDDVLLQPRFEQCMLLDYEGGAGVRARLHGCGWEVSAVEAYVATIREHLPKLHLGLPVSVLDMRQPDKGKGKGKGKEKGKQ